jgi:hypothetical protein
MTHTVYVFRPGTFLAECAADLVETVELRIVS